jgi:uncharacterized membrane protein YozB (DUF420 family)
MAVVQRDIDTINMADQPVYLQDEQSHEYFLNKLYYPLLIALAFHMLLAIECCFVTLLVLWRAVHPKQNSENQIQPEKLVEFV